MKKILIAVVLIALLVLSGCETLSQVWEDNWRDWLEAGTEAALDAGEDYVKETVKDITAEESEETEETEETEE